MAPSAFLERSAPPRNEEVHQVLGRAGGLWKQLLATLASDFAPLSEKWGFSGKAYGWSLQLRQRKKTILYMIPCSGHFVAAFALSEKACRAAQEESFPLRVHELIRNAPEYPEGKAVRLEVRTMKDLKAVLQLAARKMIS